MATQGLQQQQKQVQTMVLAPQLRQSLKILQAATLDLRSTIMEELETNPALEELPMEITSLEERLGSKETEHENTSSQDTSEVSTPEAITAEPQTASESTEEASEPPSSEEVDFTEEFEVFNKLDEEWQDYYKQEGQTSEYSNEAEKRRQHFLTL